MRGPTRWALVAALLALGAGAADLHIRGVLKNGIAVNVVMTAENPLGHAASPYRSAVDYVEVQYRTFTSRKVTLVHSLKFFSPPPPLLSRHLLPLFIYCLFLWKDTDVRGVG